MMIVGVDEAGCGPAVGSLWAAAVALPRDVPGLADSKTLTAAKRAALRKALEEQSMYGLGEVTCAEIDSVGLGEARRLVFERALDDFVRRTGGVVPDKIIVDGTLFRPWRNVDFECIEKADALVPAVSAASIFAKTQRDAQILHLCDARPELDERYGLRSNKGYLSTRHMNGLVAHGRSDVHRKSFHIRCIDGPK